jgi:methylglutaconyl-CoA hydratase
MSGLRVERDGPFARVSLDRPDVRNAFNAELIRELRETFEALSRESPDALRGVVLSGTGSVFCAGADVEWMRSAAALSVEDNERDAAALHAMLTAIDMCPVPVITRVQGAALGGGMGLCAVSDIVVATADARFGFTETKLGIIPAVISPFVVAKIGESDARALFVTGQRFDAERALRIGLVHEVAGDEAALDARSVELLDELRSAGPTAARAAKALVRELRALDPDEAREHTIRHIAQQRTSPEGLEGLGAFLDKRPARWAREE